MLTVARSNDVVLNAPEPEVYFRDFGDSCLDFELAVRLPNPESEPRVLSDLRFAIDLAFRRNDVQIPFPQRDLHLRSGFDGTHSLARAAL